MAGFYGLSRFAAKLQAEQRQSTHSQQDQGGRFGRCYCRKRDLRSVANYDCSRGQRHRVAIPGKQTWREQRKLGIVTPEIGQYQENTAHIEVEHRGLAVYRALYVRHEKRAENIRIRNECLGQRELQIDALAIQIEIDNPIGFGRNYRNRQGQQNHSQQLSSEFH